MRAMDTVDVAPTKEGSSNIFRLVSAATIGNALEWFDILIYGFFAISISKAFFPASNSGVSLLLTFGTFAISYLARPIGALVLGSYADRRGRKASMMVSIVTMMIGTTTIALTPNYETIGVAAPILVICARLLQGFSAGGEFGSTTAFLVEQCPERKGLFASFQFASQGLSYMLAAGFGVLLTLNLDGESIDSWGWRVPFLFGVLIGPVGLYLRKHLHEGDGVRHEKPVSFPVREVFVNQKARMLLAIGTLVLSTGASYVILYIPTYAVRQLHLPGSFGFIATMLTGAILTFVTPFVGYLSDKIGRIRLMTWAGVAFILTIYPVFKLLGAHPNLWRLIAMMAWIGTLKAIYFGALPALMAEVFPTTTRATGMAISYNIGVTVFGGFAPLIVESLIHATGNLASPALYLTLLGVLSLIALRGCRSMLDLQ